MLDSLKTLFPPVASPARTSPLPATELRNAGSEPRPLSIHTPPLRRIRAATLQSRGARTAERRRCAQGKGSEQRACSRCPLPLRRPSSPPARTAVASPRPEKGHDIQRMYVPQGAAGVPRIAPHSAACGGRRARARAPGAPSRARPRPSHLTPSASLGGSPSRHACRFR